MGAQARGILMLADWNQRDDRAVRLNFWEKPVMRQLFDQWSHPAFGSVEDFSELLDATRRVGRRRGDGRLDQGSFDPKGFCVSASRA